MSARGSIVPTLAAALLIAATVSLGNWQTRRGAEKLRMERQIEAAEQAEPIPLGPMLVSPAQVDVLQGRRATVRGRFLPGFGVYIDNRTYKGIAGFYLVTPLRIEGGDPGAAAMHVLVLRGWIAGDPRQRAHLPQVPAPQGTVELTGLVERDVPQALELQRANPPGPEQRIWQNVTRDVYATWSNLELQPLVLRQTEAAHDDAGPIDDGLVRDWPRPGLDVERHRGYAFQWYGLAATTTLIWLWFVVLRPLWGRRASANDGK